MNLLIGSDVVPTDSNKDLFIKGDTKQLLGKELNDLWQSADMRLFNLETPLTNKKSPINKSGPNFQVKTNTIKGIKRLNPTLVTLANNHILDQDNEGVFSTINELKKFNIPFIGAGANIKEASKPYIIISNNLKIGIYNCAENEFTIATEKNPGANPFDPLESLDHINNLKKKCDFVIVLYHGGKEYYQYPSPYLQKVCRKIVDKGADLVICQHSHCIGTFEKYRNSTIVYGQGNFIFNKSVNEHWNTGLLIDVNISENLNINYIPFIKTGSGIKLANVMESKKIINEFYKRSKNLLNTTFVEENYKRLVDDSKSIYVGRIAGFRKWKSRLDRRILNNILIENHYTKQELLAIKNTIRCEAHREILLESLDNFINKK